MEINKACVHQNQKYQGGPKRIQTESTNRSPYFLFLFRRPFMANCCDYSTLRMIVQLLSHVRFFVTPRTAACQASLSFTIFWSLLKLMSIELMSVKTSAIWAATYAIHQKHSLDPIVLFFNWG